MKNITLSSLVGVCSPNHLVSLLIKTFPEKESEILTLKPLLYTSVGMRKKLDAIRRVCGVQNYYNIIKKLHDVCHILETDLNAPILYKILEKAHVDYPKGETFQDLTVWLYLHHSELWDDFVRLSFMRSPHRQIHVCEIIPGCRSWWDYEDVSRLKKFETTITEIFSKEGFGEGAELIVDSISDGIYRAVLSLSPIGQKVTTYDATDKVKFKIKRDINARKLILVYNEKLERLWIVGRLSERKTRIALAAAWAEVFLGGTCEKEVPPPAYNLDFFLTSPLCFLHPHAFISEVRVVEMTFALGRCDVTVSLKRSDCLKPEDIQDILAHYPTAEQHLKKVRCVVVMKTPLHGIDNFDLTLSACAMSLGDAENCDDIRAAIEEVLGGFNVCSYEL